MKKVTNQHRVGAKRYIKDNFNFKGLNIKGINIK